MQTKIQIVLLSFIGLFCSLNINADQKSGIKFHGSMYTDLNLLQTVNRRKSDDADFAGISVLKLKMKNTNRKFGKVEGLFDLFIPYGKTIEMYIPENSDEDTSNSDISLKNIFELISFGKAPLLLDVRKLYLSVYLPFADITMGRQIINFGKGFVFSPIDIFTAVELKDLNFRRSGSDIVSISIPFSNLTGIDFVSELPFRDKSISVAAKVFATLFDFDLSLIAIFRSTKKRQSGENETVFGLTWKGDLKIGIYGELVGHYLPDFHDKFFEGMCGIDYSIHNKFYLVFEYLYKQYDWQYSIWGEHNFFGSIQYTINELANISANMVYNAQHKTTHGTLQWYYNILQNVNTIVYLQGTDNNYGQYITYALRVEVKF